MPTAQFPITIEMSTVYNLDNCPLFEFPIKANRCLEQTRILRRNLEVCMQCKCRSPHRRCIKCLTDGKWQSGKNIAVDFEKGLCELHLSKENNGALDLPKNTKDKNAKQQQSYKPSAIASERSPEAIPSLTVTPIIAPKDPPELIDARNVRHIIEMQQCSVTEAAHKLNKSAGWAYARLQLLNLDPKVSALMLPAPKKYRLAPAVASCLGSISPSLQLELAHEIVARCLKITEAIAFIRQRTQQMEL